jgi:hypothetical protein
MSINYLKKLQEKYPNIIEDIEVGLDGAWIYTKDPYLTEPFSHTLHEDTIRQVADKFLGLLKLWKNGILISND